MNHTPQTALSTTLSTTLSTRLASVALAAVLTLATLGGVNTLAATEGAAPLLAQGSSSQA